MPEFAYIARDAAGRKVEGLLSAASRQEVLGALGQKALYPLTIQLSSGEARSRSGGRISRALTGTFFGQLADLLRSGVPLLKSLGILEKQTSHVALRRVIEEVRGDVEEGTPISEAMARHPKAFSSIAISMVRAGAEGGFLEDALDQMGDFTEKQEDLKSRTLGAIAYPAFLATVGTIVVVVLIVFFVPKFAGLFERLREKGQLPALTEALLWTSDAFWQWWWLLLAAAAIGGLLLRSWLQTEPGQLALDRAKIRLPGAGPILLQLAVARFCRVLGTLLHNGVPILKSLEISSEATGNRLLSQAVRAAAENITAGEPLAAPLARSGQFPPNVVEMIAVAEEANTLERVLLTIADGLERRTWRRLDLLVRLLEPLLLLILAGVVLVVVIALLLPIINMSATI